MGYKIQTNKTTKHKQNIEFMGENDYETLEILILNIALSTHLNKKNLSNDIDLPSRVNPYFFQFFMATVRTTVATRTMPCLRKKNRGTVSSYLYRGTVETDIVTSARPSLLIHSSDEHADVTMSIATDNAHRY
jgi:hypothetical protein